MTPCEGFIRRYAEFGRNPSVEDYVRLFDPEGTVLHPGMTTPIGTDRISDFAARAFVNLRNYRLEPVRWGGRENTVFVEARNSAIVAGTRISWPVLYCAELRGEHVLQGRAYYDRAAILLHWTPAEMADRSPDAHSRVLEAGTTSGDGMREPAIAAALEEFASAYVEHWKRPNPARFPLFYHRDGRLINPELAHPLERDEMAPYYAEMMTQIPGLRCLLQDWAIGGRFLFFEWVVTGSVGGKLFELGMAERLTMDGALARESVGYFDSLGIHDLLDPETALRATVASWAGAGV